MIEESSWTLSSIILVIVFCILYVNNDNKHISKFLYVVIRCLIYITFMLKLTFQCILGEKFRVTEEYKRKTLIQKIYDMSKCQKISKTNEDWDDEIPWMTSYFTFGSWAALAIVIWYKSHRKMFK